MRVFIVTQYGSRKCSYILQRQLFGLSPTLHRKYSLASYFPLQIFGIKTPGPLEISIDHPWGGYEYFLELCITILKLQF